jgi:hypothetical protein
VTVLDGENNNTHKIYLVASLDEVNGGIQWNAASNINDGIPQHLHTKQWVFPMLNDHQ